MAERLSGLKPWTEEDPEELEPTDDSKHEHDSGEEDEIQFAHPDDADDDESDADEGADDGEGDDTGDGDPAADESDSGEDSSDDDAGEDAGPEFPAYLLNAAGLTAEQAKAQFKTPEALEDQLAMLDARFAQAGQWQQPVQPPVPAQGWQQPYSQQAAQQAIQQLYPQYQLPQHPEGGEWDADTKNLFAIIAQQQQQELMKRDAFLMQLHQQNQILTARHQADANRQYIESFDSFVNGLDGQWKQLLGEGSGSELNVNSLHMQNRIHLDRMANQIAAGRAAQGYPELPRRELLTRALRVAFPRQQEQSVRRKVKQDLDKRQRMMSSRPTKRKTRGVSGEEKAAKRLDQIYRQAGLPPEADDFDYSSY